MNANTKAWKDRLSRALDSIHALTDMDPTIMIEGVDISSATPTILVNRAPQIFRSCNMPVVEITALTEKNTDHRCWMAQVLLCGCIVTWVAVPATAILKIRMDLATDLTFGQSNSNHSINPDRANIS